MIKMTALGLLLMVVVVSTIVYIAGLAWLARHDVRQAERPTAAGDTAPYPDQGAALPRRTTARDH
jgi:hypothetical protein